MTIFFNLLFSAGYLIKKFPFDSPGQGRHSTFDLEEMRK